MKKLFLSVVCLVALNGSVQASVVGDPDIVVVRVTEGGGVRVVIIRGDGRPETMEFASGTSLAGLTTSGDGYYKVFKKLYDEGYTLQSTFSGASSVTSTLLFVKGQK